MAFLERHVTEQDKAMLELARELEAVRRELKLLRLQQAGASAVPGVAGEGVPPDEERPPHY